jgi:hypothetical protein
MKSWQWWNHQLSAIRLIALRLTVNAPADLPTGTGLHASTTIAFPCPSGGDLCPSPGAAARLAGRLHVGARLLCAVRGA